MHLVFFFNLAHGLNLALILFDSFVFIVRRLRLIWAFYYFALNACLILTLGRALVVDAFADTTKLVIGTCSESVMRSANSPAVCAGWLPASADI